MGKQQSTGTITYLEYVALRDSLDAAQQRAAIEWDAVRDDLALHLNFFCGAPMGLTPDAIKFHTDYRKAQTEWRVANKKVKSFCALYAKRFARDESAAIMAKRMAKLEGMG